MKCDVPSCPNDSEHHPGQRELCDFHWESWGWYLQGYGDGRGTQVGVGKDWDLVMKKFLEQADRNLKGLAMFAAAIYKRAGG